MHRTRSDVVGEDILKLLDVLRVEEVIQERLGQTSKGLVGGGEDGERASTGERVDELASLEGGNEGGQIGGGDSKIDDGLGSRSRRCRRSGRGNEHMVDDVDHAVRSVDVSLGHLRIVDEDTAAEDASFHFLALHSLDLLVVLQILRVHRTRSDMVGEHILKLLDVLRVEEMVQERFGKTSEGLVGGGEDGERASTRKRVNKFASLEGGDEGGQIGGGDSKINNRGGLCTDGSHGLGRDEHAVDDVDHAVRSVDVSLGHFGVVDEDMACVAH